MVPPCSALKSPKQNDWRSFADGSIEAQSSVLIGRQEPITQRREPAGGGGPRVGGVGGVGCVAANAETEYETFDHSDSSK